MFSKITAIAWKDTIIRFSSKSELLFFLILPIVFTFLLGGAFGGPGTENQDNRIVLLVVDEDQSDLSQTLLTSLRASEAIRIENQPLTEAETAFADEKAPALLLIPAGFAEAVLAGKLAVLDFQQQPNNNDAQIAAQAVTTAVTTISRPLTIAQTSVQQAEQQQPFAHESEKTAYFKEGQTLAKTASCRHSRPRHRHPARIRTRPSQRLRSGRPPISRTAHHLGLHSPVGHLRPARL